MIDGYINSGHRPPCYSCLSRIEGSIDTAPQSMEVKGDGNFSGKTRIGYVTHRRASELDHVDSSIMFHYNVHSDVWMQGSVAERQKPHSLVNAPEWLLSLK